MDNLHDSVSDFKLLIFIIPTSCVVKDKTLALSVIVNPNGDEDIHKAIEVEIPEP